MERIDYADVYEQENHKIGLLVPKETDRVNKVFVREPWTLKTFKALKVENGLIMIRRRLNYIQNERGKIDYGHAHRYQKMFNHDEYGCPIISDPDKNEWEVIINN